MINRIKYWLTCNKTRVGIFLAHMKLWGLFLFIMTVGAVIGMILQRKQSEAEITRLQTINTELIATINTRLPPLAAKLDESAGQVANVTGQLAAQIGQATTKLDQATDAAVQAGRRADTAAVNVTKSLGRRATNPAGGILIPPAGLPSMPTIPGE